MLTIKNINKALEKEFDGKLELVKGKDYFYFAGELSTKMVETGIYTATLHGVTIESVIKTAKAKINFFNS